MNADTKCTVCGEPMPPGETMFKFHGYSGPCPKPPLPRAAIFTVSTQPVVVPDEPDATRVTLSVGVQSFHVGPEYWETNAEAEQFAAMLATALETIARSRA